MLVIPTFIKIKNRNENKHNIIKFFPLLCKRLREIKLNNVIKITIPFSLFLINHSNSSSMFLGLYFKTLKAGIKDDKTDKTIPTQYISSIEFPKLIESIPKLALVH